MVVLGAPVIYGSCGKTFLALVPQNKQQLMKLAPPRRSGRLLELGRRVHRAGDCTVHPVLNSVRANMNELWPLPPIGLWALVLVRWLSPGAAIASVASCLGAIALHGSYGGRSARLEDRPQAQRTMIRAPRR